MFKLFTKLFAFLIPFLILFYSISTVLVDSNMHKEALKNDNFYNRIVLKSDSMVSKVGLNYFQTLGLPFQTPTEVGNDKGNLLLFQKALEKNIQTTVENFFDNLSYSITNKRSVAGSSDYVVQATNILAEFYAKKDMAIASMVVLLLLIFVLSILRGGTYFSFNSKFYFNIFWNLIGLSLICIFTLVGFSFLGSGMRTYLSSQFGISSLDFDILEIINYQYFKFVLSLFVPALYISGSFLGFSVLLSFFAIFQKDEKHYDKEFDKKMNRAQKVSSSDDYHNSSRDPLSKEYTRTFENEYNHQQSPEIPTNQDIETIALRPATPTKSLEQEYIIIPTVNNVKESIDPFLQRLSKDLNATTGKSTYNLSGLNSSIDEDGVQTIKIK